MKCLLSLFSIFTFLFLLCTSHTPLLAQIEKDSCASTKAFEVPPPPPPPPPPPNGNVESDRYYETPPLFPACQNLLNLQEREACAKKSILEYIYSKLEYPENAEVEGIVVIQFIVDEKGNIENAKIVRDIGQGCGEAALKVVNSMKLLPTKWTPGKMRGKPVKILYTLPVKFDLGNKD